MVRAVTNILFDLPADPGVVGAHVNGDLDVDLVSITVDSLLDGSNELVSLDGRRSSGISFAFGS